MNFVALRMLTGDRAKYFGLVFAIAFSHLPAREPDLDLRQRPEAHG